MATYGYLSGSMMLWCYGLCSPSFLGSVFARNPSDDGVLGDVWVCPGGWLFGRNLDAKYQKNWHVRLKLFLAGVVLSVSSRSFSTGDRGAP